MGIWERDEGIRTAVEAGLGELAAEVYVTAQLERSFRTLDYYKSILPQEEPTYD